MWMHTTAFACSAGKRQWRFSRIGGRSGRRVARLPIDVESGLNSCMARLDMLALGCDMAVDPPDVAYVLERRGSPRAFIAILVKLSGSFL